MHFFVRLINDDINILTLKINFSIPDRTVFEVNKKFQQINGGDDLVLFVINNSK